MTSHFLLSVRIPYNTPRSPGLTIFTILEFYNCGTRQNIRKCLLDSSKQIATSIPEVTTSIKVI